MKLLVQKDKTKSVLLLKLIMQKKIRNKTNKTMKKTYRGHTMMVEYRDIHLPMKRRPKNARDLYVSKKKLSYFQ